jgi:hypothetical protein
MWIDFGIRASFKLLLECRSVVLFHKLLSTGTGGEGRPHNRWNNATFVVNP